MGSLISCHVRLLPRSGPIERQFGISPTTGHLKTELCHPLIHPSSEPSAHSNRVSSFTMTPSVPYAPWLNHYDYLALPSWLCSLRDATELLGPLMASSS